VFRATADLLFRCFWNFFILHPTVSEILLFLLRTLVIRAKALLPVHFYIDSPSFLLGEGGFRGEGGNLFLWDIFWNVVLGGGGNSYFRVKNQGFGKKANCDGNLFFALVPRPFLGFVFQWISGCVGWISGDLRSGKFRPIYFFFRRDAFFLLKASDFPIWGKPGGTFVTRKGDGGLKKFSPPYFQNWIGDFFHPLPLFSCFAFSFPIRGHFYLDGGGF